MYRGLVNAAWRRCTPPATATTRSSSARSPLTARTRPRTKRSFGLPGAYGETPPLEFIRELYCLNPSYQPYRGAAARVRKCPTTAAASRRFRAQNPALFQASGCSDPSLSAWRRRQRPRRPRALPQPQLRRVLAATEHDQGARPGPARVPLGQALPALEHRVRLHHQPAEPSEHYSSLATQPRTTTTGPSTCRGRTLGSRARCSTCSTTRTRASAPPSAAGSQAGWCSSRARPRREAAPRYPPGAPKPGLDAYRLPIYLPKGTARHGHVADGLGLRATRPLSRSLDTHQPQTAQIQFQRGGTARGQRWRPSPTATPARAATSPGGSSSRPAAPSGSSYQYPVSDIRLEPGIDQAQYYDPLTPSVSRSASVTIR